MPQFNLETWTPAKALHANKREENHGQELVDAMTMKWRIEVPNTRLDEWFGPRLRHSLYVAAGSRTIEGVPDVTPELRTDQIEGPHKIRGEFVGYIVKVRRGMGASAAREVELGQTELSSFQLDAKQGGTCILDFKTNNAGLDEDTMGKLCAFGGRDVEIMAIPPKLQDGTLPDGHKAAAKPGKAKPVSAKQMSLKDSPDDGPEPGQGAVNPFKFSVVDGELVDNNPVAGQERAAMDSGEGDPIRDAATAAFLALHGGPDDSNVVDAEFVAPPAGPDPTPGDDAAATGLATDLQASAARATVKRAMRVEEAKQKAAAKKVAAKKATGKKK